MTHGSRWPTADHRRRWLEGREEGRPIRSLLAWNRVSGAGHNSQSERHGWGWGGVFLARLPSSESKGAGDLLGKGHSSQR